MHHMRGNVPVQTVYVGDGGKFSEGIFTAAPPIQGVQSESFGADAVAVLPHPRGDMDFPARVTGCPRQANPMGPEIPILGDEEQQPTRRGRASFQSPPVIPAR
ncbi:hypothetical protein GCM10009099_23100 [Caenispirillum bisanense]